MAISADSDHFEAGFETDPFTLTKGMYMLVVPSFVTLQGEETPHQNDLDGETISLHLSYDNDDNFALYTDSLGNPATVSTVNSALPIEIAHSSVRAKLVVSNGGGSPDVYGARIN